MEAAQSQSLSGMFNDFGLNELWVGMAAGAAGFLVGAFATANPAAALACGILSAAVGIEKADDMVRGTIFDREGLTA